MFFVFSFGKPPNIQKKGVKMSTWVNFRIKGSQNEYLGQFLDKSDEKVVHETTYLLKLKSYNTDRKMKSIIRCIFISIIMLSNFTHFCQKISFKSTLEIFTPVSGHLKTK